MDKGNIEYAIKQFEIQMRKRIKIGYNDVIRDVNECLSRTLKATAWNAERLELSIAADIDTLEKQIMNNISIMENSYREEQSHSSFTDCVTNAYSLSVSEINSNTDDKKVSRSNASLIKKEAKVSKHAKKGFKVDKANFKGMCNNIVSNDETNASYEEDIDEDMLALINDSIDDMNNAKNNGITDENTPSVLEENSNIDSNKLSLDNKCFVKEEEDLNISTKRTSKAKNLNYDSSYTASKGKTTTSHNKGYENNNIKVRDNIYATNTAPVKTQLKKNVSCEKCSYKTDRGSSLKKHVETVHYKQRNFRCKECGNAFTQSSSLNFHLRKNHGLLTQLKN